MEADGSSFLNARMPAEKVWVRSASLEASGGVCSVAFVPLDFCSWRERSESFGMVLFAVKEPSYGCVSPCTSAGSAGGSSFLPSFGAAC